MALCILVQHSALTQAQLGWLSVTWEQPIFIPAFIHSWLRLHFYVAPGDSSSDPQAFAASDLIFLALVLSLNSFILNCRSMVFGAKFSLIQQIDSYCSILPPSFPPPCLSLPPSSPLGWGASGGVVMCIQPKTLDAPSTMKYSPSSVQQYSAVQLHYYLSPPCIDRHQIVSTVNICVLVMCYVDTHFYFSQADTLESWSRIATLYSLPVQPF